MLVVISYFLFNLKHNFMQISQQNLRNIQKVTGNIMWHDVIVNF